MGIRLGTKPVMYPTREDIIRKNIQMTKPHYHAYAWNPTKKLFVESMFKSGRRLTNVAFDYVSLPKTIVTSLFVQTINEPVRLKAESHSMYGAAAHQLSQLLGAYSSESDWGLGQAGSNLIVRRGATPVISWPYRCAREDCGETPFSSGLLRHPSFLCSNEALSSLRQSDDKDCAR